MSEIWYPLLILMVSSKVTGFLDRLYRAVFGFLCSDRKWYTRMGGCLEKISLCAAQGRSILLIGSAIRGEKVPTCRISKETKVLPPEQEGGKENFCFFPRREWDQLIPWLAPRWPFWGPFWVNHGWKKQKFSFPPSCSGGKNFCFFWNPSSWLYFTPDGATY